jgi:hypothetical protein
MPPCGDRSALISCVGAFVDVGAWLRDHELRGTHALYFKEARQSVGDPIDTKEEYS